jgi:hypothetical protein
MTASASYAVVVGFGGRSFSSAKLVEKPEGWSYSSASGVFVLDPLPQGRKPHFTPSTKVGAKGPTPNSFTRKHRAPKASAINVPMGETLPAQLRRLHGGPKP